MKKPLHEIVRRTRGRGSGNALDNLITGNDAANTLSGLEGNDTLDGGKGADTMLGGLADIRQRAANDAIFGMRRVG